MAGQFFKKKWGQDPSKFKTIEEVNKFIEKRLGRKLDGEYRHEDISPGGNVFPIEKTAPPKKAPLFHYKKSA